MKDDTSRGIDELQDAINMLALVGSAAACRGGSSSKVADEIAILLSRLASEGILKSDYFGIANPLDCVRRSSDNARKISITAGNALGSILNVKNGGPF